ncbi:phosphoribosylformylglycinamidine cyclo-ligase [bacterium]|nr:phosphoribosylformylglycinamidine cyclo-ligase [bacterium]
MSTFTYKEAGVNIEAGNTFVSKIKGLVKTTFRPETLIEIGGFSGLFAPQFTNFKDPVLVSSCDGVGTKIKIAVMANKHETIGIDLVAMCVNDVIAMGGEPLFILDYFATGKLDLNLAETVIKGIVEGSKIANCSLLGGETAEMPDFYPEGEYDLAGFCVGIVDRSKIITGEKIEPTNQIIGLASSGVHSNGYSLIRKIFSSEELLDLSSTLLTPTKIYVNLILNLTNKFTLNGIAHITGGGLIENVQRILPLEVDAEIYKESWEILEIFNLIQKKGNISQEEMYKTFNMGIGMVLVVPGERTEIILEKIKSLGEKAHLIGQIKKGQQRVIIR